MSALFIILLLSFYLTFNTFLLILNTLHLVCLAPAPLSRLMKYLLDFQANF